MFVFFIKNLLNFFQNHTKTSQYCLTIILHNYQEINLLQLIFFIDQGSKGVKIKGVFEGCTKSLIQNWERLKKLFSKVFIFFVWKSHCIAFLFYDNSKEKFGLLIICQL